MPERVRVAILGSGNIGTDLMYKLLDEPGHMELGLLAGIDPESEGLARARGLGIDASHEGLDAVLSDPSLKIVFDATSAGSHRRHAPLLAAAHRIAVDMTPAAIGPLVVPAVDQTGLDHHNVNLITCGGQATVPVAHAVARSTPVRYAEMVSTVASVSAGPGTRHNIDEFTFTTARALEQVGEARAGKAIIILNPADPPIVMRNTVYAVPEDDLIDAAAVTESIEAMVADVQHYVPGYRLVSAPVFDRRATPWGERTVVAVMLEVRGAGHFLPPYAGNLDIMTAAARRVGELFAQQLTRSVEVTA